jgi:hypothetical protein
VTSAGVADWSTDGVVAVLASLVSASVVDGAAHLEWRVAPLAGVTVERSDDGVSWSARGALVADGGGEVRFADAGLAPGRYGWRLVLATPEGATRAGETWLDVPRTLALALSGARPNPASDRLVVSFVLPARAGARLELLDVAGRRVRSREVGSLGPGAHAVDLGSSGLGPGIYLLRLTQGARSVTTRATLLR